VVENEPFIIRKGHGLRRNETAASPVGAEVTSTLTPFHLLVLRVAGLVFDSNNHKLGVLAVTGCAT
jgi:hypothetical protein